MSAQDVIAAMLHAARHAGTGPGGPTSRDVIEALAEDGYAVVKLPEADEFDAGVPAWYGPVDGSYVECPARETVGIVTDSVGAEVSPDAARLHAAALLAAARHAEAGGDRG